jgi:TolB protein
VFDVNKNNLIAFVRYEEGKPEIYLKTQDKEERALQLTTEDVISDVAFSPNGTLLYYSVIDRDHEKSIIYALDVRSFDQKEIYQDKALITEIAFDPNDEKHVYYLQAGTFENYSPIAQARPHDYDVFSYDIDLAEATQHTFLKTYAMDSLQVSEDGESVYVQMADEREAKTADDIFDMKQRIFEIPLENPEAMTIVGDADASRDIWAFAMLPGEESLIFQTVSNEAAGGNFQYELYYFDLTTLEEKRITDVKTYAGNPVIAADGKTIYFIVNEGFATSHDDYSLYRVGIDGEDLTETQLEHP